MFYNVNFWFFLEFGWFFIEIFWKGLIDKSLLNGFLAKANLQGLIKQIDSNWKFLIIDHWQLPNLKEILYESKAQGISISSNVMTSEECEKLKILISENL